MKNLDKLRGSILSRALEEMELLVAAQIIKTAVHNLALQDGCVVTELDVVFQNTRFFSLRVRSAAEGFELEERHGLIRLSASARPGGFGEGN